LADAIFPTDANNMGHSLEPLHHGLLNHKMEIEKLHNTAEPVHHGLLNHKIEIEKLYNTAERLSSILEKQQRCTSNQQMLHSAHEAKHAAMKSTLKDTQESATASNILSKNNSTTLNKHVEMFQTMKEQQKEQFAGLVNHRDTLRSLQETQTNLKVKAEKHDKSLLQHEESLKSMQRSLTEIQNNLQQQHMTPQRLEDLHQRAQSLERNIQAQNSKMNSLVSANNAINSNLECLQKQALSDRQVQFQVLAPRRK
jgi:chromosome segregation ATPase